MGNIQRNRLERLLKKLEWIYIIKKDSEEICFVPDGNHGNFISNREKIVKGNFVDKDGKVLGEHKGIVYYTIGQRKGLNLPLGKPVYVIGINSKTNEVIIGSEKDLFLEML